MQCNAIHRFLKWRIFTFKNSSKTNLRKVLLKEQYNISRIELRISTLLSLQVKELQIKVCTELAKVICQLP